MVNEGCFNFHKSSWSCVCFSSQARCKHWAGSPSGPVGSCCLVPASMAVGRSRWTPVSFIGCNVAAPSLCPCGLLTPCTNCWLPRHGALNLCWRSTLCNWEICRELIGWHFFAWNRGTGRKILISLYLLQQLVLRSSREPRSSVHLAVPNFSHVLASLFRLFLFPSHTLLAIPSAPDNILVDGPTASGSALKYQDWDKCNTFFFNTLPTLVGD